MTEYLEQEDGLLIAESMLDIKAEVLKLGDRIGLFYSALAAPAASWGGVEFYPDLAVKAAVLCGHIAKNHGLPDANKRVGLLCMIIFLNRNGYVWTPPDEDWDGEVSDQKVRALAASDLSEEVIAEFARWVRIHAGM